MRRFFLYAVVTFVGAGFVLSLAFLRGLSDFDLSGYEQAEIQFSTDQGLMSGTLVLPSGIDQPPIAVFVHGDGPQDRFGSDGYLIPMRLLLEAGIGVFSWDKPGIGGSEGNWLHQSMNDRAEETSAALAAIQGVDGVDPAKVGFLGFSQAGWVVPEAVGPGSAAAFAILVGGATNWEDQGAYYGRQRDRLGLRTNERAPMSADREAFVLRNQASDATVSLGKISVPFLALFGSEDLNVDPDHNAAIYTRLTGALRSENKIMIVDGATHGLLRASLFNYQLSSDWPGWAVPAFVLAGRYAFAPGVWDEMADWIKAVIPAED